MTWRDDRLPAKYKDAEFFVRKIDSEAGRRKVLHEFPGRDLPSSEDMGKATRRFSVEGFVIGDDYMIARDKLIKALEDAAAGTLVHPYWGNVLVQPDGPAKISETPDEGGIARFQMAFVRVGKQNVPVVRVATPAALRIACDLAVPKVTLSFSLKFTILGLLESILKAIDTVVSAVMDAIDQVRSIVQAAINAVDTVKASINAIKNAVESLLALPGQFANALSAIFDAVFGWISGENPARDGAPAPDLTDPTQSDSRVSLVDQVLKNLGNLNIDTSAPVVDTPSREQQVTNLKELARLVNGLTAIRACRTVSFLSFSSFDQATTMRGSLVAALDKVLLDTEDDNVYLGLVAVRAATIEHLEQVATSLPLLAGFTPTVTQPALLIAHRIYGDATRELEIVARNKSVRHPGFVQGGVQLQVVSDA